MHMSQLSVSVLCWKGPSSSVSTLIFGPDVGVFQYDEDPVVWMMNSYKD